MLDHLLALALVAVVLYVVVYTQNLWPLTAPPPPPPRYPGTPSSLVEPVVDPPAPAPAPAPALPPIFGS